MKKESAPKDANSSQKDSSTPPTKHEMALYDLLAAGLTGISKLTELPSYGETSLPTTISELGIVRGFVIARESRPHTHRHGGKTTFSWYWLADREEACKAVSQVNRMRRVRGAETIPEWQAEKFVGAFPLPADTGGDAA